MKKLTIDSYGFNGFPFSVAPIPLLQINENTITKCEYIPIEGYYRSFNIAKNTMLQDIRKKFPGFILDDYVKEVVDEYVFVHYNIDTHTLPHYETVEETAEITLVAIENAEESIVPVKEKNEYEKKVMDWLDKMDWGL